MVLGGRLVALATVFLAACTIGGVHALPPGDAGLSSIDTDGGAENDDDGGLTCAPGVDSDGDGAFDCDELIDADPFTDPMIYNGLTAMIGDRPEWSGSCSSLDDHAEMISHFASSTKT